MVMMPMLFPVQTTKPKGIEPPYFNSKTIKNNTEIL
jgi:hypothetical protein